MATKINSGLVAHYATAIVLAFIFIFPLVFMIMASFKTENQIFADLRSFRAFLPVGDLTLDNYRDVFSRGNFLLYMGNSVFIAVTTIALGVLFNSMMAFALCRMQWRGQAFALTLVIALLIIPLEAIVIPMLMMVAQLPWIGWEDGGLVIESSWLNSLHVQIIPFIANAFSIFLFYQFFRDIPKDMDEAARMDGASWFQIYWRIVMPLSGPVIATVIILQFLTMWNQYLWPILVTQGEEARPVMLGLTNFFGRTTDWGPVMAYASLITIPVLILFLVFQRHFVQSVISSGIKG